MEQRGQSRDDATLARDYDSAGAFVYESSANLEWIEDIASSHRLWFRNVNRADVARNDWTFYFVSVFVF